MKLVNTLGTLHANVSAFDRLLALRQEQVSRLLGSEAGPPQR